MSVNSMTNCSVMNHLKLRDLARLMIKLLTSESRKTTPTFNCVLENTLMLSKSSKGQIIFILFVDFPRFAIFTYLTINSACLANATQAAIKVFSTTEEIDCIIESVLKL